MGCVDSAIEQVPQINILKDVSNKNIEQKEKQKQKLNTLQINKKQYSKNNDESVQIESYVEELLKLIRQSVDLQSLIGIQVFKNIETKLKQFPLFNQSKVQISKLLEQYIQFVYKHLKQNKSEQQIEHESNVFLQKYSEKIRKIFLKIKTKQKWVLGALDYFSQFKSYKFQFCNQSNQYKKLSNDIKRQYMYESLSIFYLSLYFVKSCEKMQANGKSVEQINEQLKTVSTLLKNQFSVKNKNDFNLKILKDELNIGLKLYYNKIFQQELDRNFKQKIIKLQGDNKEQTLQKQIISMVEFSKKTHQFFDSIVQQACIKSGGFGFKSNLKLKSAQQKSSLVRVKQKLLKNYFGKFNKPQGCKSLKQLKQKQEEAFQQLLKSTYKNLTQIKFTVSDLLRGKCLFNRLDNIYKAALLIITRIKEQSAKGRNISIVQFDNRIQGITEDFVLKIRIEQLVCEFQLVLAFSEAENTIHHKMYELVRSKILSPTTLLYQWNEKALQMYVGTAEKYLRIKENSKRSEQLASLKQYIGIQLFQNSMRNDNKQVKVYRSKFVQKIKQNQNKISQILEQNKKIFQVNKLKNTLKILRLTKQHQKQLQIIKNNYKFTDENIPHLQQALKNQKQFIQLCQYYKTYDLQTCSTILITAIKQKLLQCSQYSQFYATLLKILSQYIEICTSGSGSLTYYFKNVQKNLQKSITLFQYFEQEFQRKYPNLDYLNALQLYGKIQKSDYNNLPKYLNQLNKCLALKQKLYGKSSTNYAQTLNILSLVHTKFKQAKLKFDYAKKSLSIYTNNLGNNHPDLIPILLTLAQLYKYQGKKDIQQQYLSWAIKIKQAVYGWDEKDRQWLIQFDSHICKYIDYQYIDNLIQKTKTKFLPNRNHFTEKMEKFQKKAWKKIEQI